MNIRRTISTCLCAALIFTCIASQSPARAEDKIRDDAPIRIYATAESGPIGSVDSIGGISVDGRSVPGKHMLWRGELVRVSGGQGARVTIDSIGQVTLARGAVVKFATGFARHDRTGSRPVMIASLVSGNMVVRLHSEAMAYVQACGSRVAAESGASFRVVAVDGRAKVDVMSGKVDVQSQSEARSLQHVEPDPATPGQFIVLDGSLSVEARSTRQIQFRVTDANDKPVPDLPVVITLASTGKSVGLFSGGTTTFSATTNAQGVVSAPFTAGPSSATGSVTANVPGSGLSKPVKLEVRDRFWTNRKKIMAGAGAVAAVIVLIPRDPGPVQQQPPPTIVP
jgi:hypothetical protein